MRRRGFGLIAVAALVALGTLFAAGCGSDSSQSADSTTPEKTADVHGRARLDPEHQPHGIYVAKEKGYFADEGLDLKILPYSGANTDVLVAQGKADLGVSFVPQVLVSTRAGIPVTAVGAITSPQRRVACRARELEVPAAQGPRHRHHLRRFRAAL